MRKDPSWQAWVNKEAGVSDDQVVYATGWFEVDWQEKTAACPQGKRSVSCGEYTSKSRGEYIRVRFAKKDYSGCPAGARCTRGERRQLTLHPEKKHCALEEMRQLMQTGEGKRLYAKRAGVEGTISPAVRRCGLRRTRYRGLAKTHLGHLATAAGLNLARTAA